MTLSSSEPTSTVAASLISARSASNGGVAANKYIRKKFKELENTLKIRVYYPDLKYCGDNAAMIAFVGSMMTPSKHKSIKSKVRARWPLNELKE